MRIVFFYSVVVHHLIGVIKEIVKSNPQIIVDVIYFDKVGIDKSKYIIEGVSNVKFHARSSFNKFSLLTFLIESNPNILYIPGWMDKEYLWALKKYRNKGNHTKTVIGIDDQWYGTLRQLLGVVYFKLTLKKYIDFMWVAGMPQYHYARMFSYQPEYIISNLLSADTSIFNFKSSFCKRIVFLGRFVSQKNILFLVDVYKSMPESFKEEWPLFLIGSGPVSNKLSLDRFVIQKPFLQPKELVKELSDGGVLCLPSIFEPWGVVVHEAAILGYPLLLSSACGSAPDLLIDNYNGFIFNCNSKSSLKKAFFNLRNLSDQDLELFSERSTLMAKKFSASFSAKSLLSILVKH